MGLKTFSIGGVHPPENKLSADRKIEILPVPEEVVIPLGQHIGAPASAIVKKGDQVKTGQLIAQAGGFVSAAIHSPVSGSVTKVDEVLDASGYRKPAIYIKTDGDEWEETIDRSEKLITTCNLDSKAIIEKIKDAGIVGLGGATFPTHIKLSPPPGMKAEVLIINGVECEPYLTSDHRVMLEKSDELLVGIEILKKALHVDRAIIGIENNKRDAIKLLTDKAARYGNTQVVALKVQYPQGGEKQLIKATINREVPSGQLPISVGAVVQNVGTALAVYDAVQKNKPLFERVVTVTGKSLKQPGNFLVRLGTPVKTLIEAAGGLPEDTGKIIGGGPMMGKALVNTDIPVTKGSSGILIIKDEEAKRKPMQNCIRCGKCVNVCPMGLAPYLLMVLGEKDAHDRSEKERIMDCIECGSCSFTCPANRPLLDYIRLEKGKVGTIIRNRKN
ncbi:electron transport complex subunit RsxC [Saccharicrinis sp. FJH54]|uniref:electron transport complex subunit RsxC n=1 Tax=Saccharicrinis sp. FJH54 TaxID=3344665 RepID=UPI0035D42C12